jgi:hypothetical protein
MKTKLGLTFLSVAAFGLAGCLSGADQSAEARQDRANGLKFIQQSSAPLTAKVGAQEIPSGTVTDPNEIIAENLKKIGCPKLASLFSDLMNYTGEGEFPSSFNEYLSCYGLSATPTQEEIDGIYEKFQNPQELLDCICGGTGLTDYLNSVNFQWSVFQGAASTAAGSAFSGASSAAAGSAFSGSSSSAGGSGFSGSQSSASGSTFSGN